MSGGNNGLMEPALHPEANKNDRRYELIFHQFYDVVIEIDLATGKYTQKAFLEDKLFSVPSQGSYETFFYQATEGVHPADVGMIREKFNLEALRRAWRDGDKEISRQYQWKGKNGDYVWREAMAIFWTGEDGVSVILVHRNINQQKEQELRREMLHQYDMALRNIYDELYEMNLTRNTYRLIYKTEGKFVIPPEQGDLDSAVRLVAEQMIYPDDRPSFLTFFSSERALAPDGKNGDSSIGEFRKLCVDGSYRWASLTILPLRPDDNREDDVIYLCFVMDIDEKKQADAIAEQNRLLQSQKEGDERYRIIVEQTSAMVFEWTRENNSRFVSPLLIQDYWGSYDGRDLFRVWEEDGVTAPEDVPRMHELMQEVHRGKEHAEATFRLLHKKRGYLWCRVAVTCLHGEDGGIKRIVGTVSEVDDAIKSEQELKYRAEYDTLTGIFNIHTFYARCEALLRGHPEQQYAIIRMDINRFKFINDIYGLEEGDKMLCFIATIIREMMTVNDAYGRLGGDVFCICLSFEEEPEILALIQRLIRRLDGYGLGYKVQPFFGICVVEREDRCVPASILCDWANLALNTVKGNLLRQWAFYDDELRARQLDERMIENEMQEALDNREFTVFLQPKHDIFTRRVVGAEALVRWLHPREGLMAPDRFIPLFEKNGFIVQLDQFVWEETCRIVRSWIDRGWTPVPVSINVSRMHIYNPDFAQSLLDLTRKYNLPHKLIELELTESTFIENTEELYATMEMLQSFGFSFSMDDFGSGYSSLNMLKNAPINAIKLDREFLNETVSTRRGQTVIRYTVMMAKKLDFHVIAEGVETGEQAAFLLQSGCTDAQGFYFSRPMPQKDFEHIAFEVPPAQ